MFCGDPETVPEKRIQECAQWVYEEQLAQLRRCEDSVRGRLREMQSSFDERSFVSRLHDWNDPPSRSVRIAHIVSGFGEFLARKATEALSRSEGISLADRLGEAASACAPAYAVAVLAAESR